MASSRSIAQRMPVRRSFGRLSSAGSFERPHLIDIQRGSYLSFCPNPGSTDEGGEGMREAFQAIFPIADHAGRAKLEYMGHTVDVPLHDPEECRRRSLTYAAPLRVKLRLTVFEEELVGGERMVKDSKEQPCFMGDVPLMTESGTFVINGSERVVVSQMHRSPGALFSHDKGRNPTGEPLYVARVIPERGAWLDFDFDARGALHVRLDRRHKLGVVDFLRSLRDSWGEDADPKDVGMSSQEILDTFYTAVVWKRAGAGYRAPFDADTLRGGMLREPLIDARTGDVFIEANTRITARVVRQIKEQGVTERFSPLETFSGCWLGRDLVDVQSQEVVLEAGKRMDEETLERLAQNPDSFPELPIIDVDNADAAETILKMMAVSRSDNPKDARRDIYYVQRRAAPPTQEAADKAFREFAFDPAHYDLSAVGRVKMNMRLGLEAPDTQRTLRKVDILAILKTLFALRKGKGDVDDIDNLGNRRVRTVGELVQGQFRLGLTRMERAARERMSSVDMDKATPQDLVNAKPVIGVIREFFGSSQLSQFMDQTNPLAEITHKRRLSALGPSGLTRERAGFEVRDVHPTHYGRICPIETPEGPNIGLINSLASYSRVNRYGFIETPYRVVREGMATDEVIHLSANEERRYHIAQANMPMDSEGTMTEETALCRFDGEFAHVPPKEVNLMDVSPKQIVSVAASLIPFLENDDANRALMGSNMQRQAVPPLQPEAPLVGTGMESVVARDSGAAVTARRGGVVDQVDAKRIFVRATGDLDPESPVVDIYNLRKFQRSNQSTCINQRPLVRVGDVVSAGDIIADGPATDRGELALGRNVLVAFMPWNGYNFEDAILVSERLVRDDVFTSLHIEEFEAVARDTKLGPEDITRDIPNVAEEALANLDEAGVIHIGAEVRPGDILVGKVTPKDEAPVTPEEKLLRAIFGEKAADVRDTSLRASPSVSGTVVEVRVFNRPGVDKDERAMAIEREERERLGRDKDDEIRVLARNIAPRLIDALEGSQVAQISGEAAQTLAKGDTITREVLATIPRHLLWDIVPDDDAAIQVVKVLRENFSDARKRVEERFANQVDKLAAGDDMPTGVMKSVKVFLAVKRKLQPGDKMAGRHGNKGVVSRILPMEDMPHLPDGTPMDIVLNPLGVPSRMNIGQVLETHLGWACVGVGVLVTKALEAWRRTQDSKPLREAVRAFYGDTPQATALLERDDEDLARTCAHMTRGAPVATPVFEGATEEDIDATLRLAGLETNGQVTLYDGLTGEPFARKVTVGHLYMLKLNHLVDDKLHARSTGSYSLVTQQPLGGKAHFGGQRFGEMEVWALEAYGAAYTLREMLTIKSDDVAGRAKAYEDIVKGEESFDSGMPESFNVLIKEMRALGMDVEPRRAPTPAFLQEPQDASVGDGEK